MAASRSRAARAGFISPGRDDLSVVDNRLRVYGVESLRIADGSILPRLPTGNTMASCVIIGERGAEMLKEEHGL